MTRLQMLAKGFLLMALLPGSSSFVTPSAPPCTCAQQATNRRCATLLFANNNGILGLNEDGDFALVGINMNEAEPPPATYLDRTMPQSALQARNEIDERFLGLMSASGLSGKATTSSTTISPIATTPQKSIDSSTKTPAASALPRDSTPIVEDDNNNDEIESLLQDIFPSLPATEIQRYAAGLRNIGFDPACESRFYLQADDLTFMKLLHGRYFVAEIVGHE